MPCHGMGWRWADVGMCLDVADGRFPEPRSRVSPIDCGCHGPATDPCVTIFRFQQVSTRGVSANRPRGSTSRYLSCTIAWLVDNPFHPSNRGSGVRCDTRDEDDGCPLQIQSRPGHGCGLSRLTIPGIVCGSAQGQLWLRAIVSRLSSVG